MKKGWKIALWITGSIILLLEAGIYFADVIVDKVLTTQLDGIILNLDTVRMEYDDIRVNLFRGEASITNFSYQSDTLPDDSVRAFYRTEAREVRIEGIRYAEYLFQRRALIEGITVVEPRYTGRLTDDNENRDAADRLSAHQREEMELALMALARYAKEVQLGRFSLLRAKVNMQSTSSGMHFHMGDTGLDLYGLGYTPNSATPFHFNDSIFRVMLTDLHIVMPDSLAVLSIGHAKVDPGQRRLTIRNLHFATDTILRPHTEYHSIAVDSIVLDDISLPDLNLRKDARVGQLSVIHPTYIGRIDETKKQAPAQAINRRDVLRILREVQEQESENLAPIIEFFQAAYINQLQVVQADIDLSSTRTPFYCHVLDGAVGFNGLSYSLIDSIPYHYDDSTYFIAVREADIMTPDSLIRISAAGLQHRDGGPVYLGPAHIRHTVDRWGLSGRKGMEPETWIDLHIAKAATSPINLLKEDWMAGTHIDTVTAHIERLECFRDARYKPSSPYRMPQTFLFDLPYAFHLQKIFARMDSLLISVALSEKAVGEMAMHDIHAVISNITNHQGDTILVQGSGFLGDGAAEIAMHLMVDSACHWDMGVEAEDMNLADVNTLLYPFAGLRVGARAPRISARYSGDSLTAAGSFLMTYDSLSIRAYKNSPSPFTIVSRFAGLINSAGRLLPKHSRTNARKEPLAYHVQWKNDPWQPIAVFFIGPIINGVMETLLPGIFTHKRIKRSEADEVPNLIPLPAIETEWPEYTPPATSPETQQQSTPH